MFYYAHHVIYVQAKKEKARNDPRISRPKVYYFWKEGPRTPTPQRTR
jgi:hypothetical protein